MNKFNGIPDKKYLPESAHPLIDTLADLRTKRAEADRAHQQYNRNTAAGKAAEREAQAKDRKELAAAALADKPLVPNKHYRVWQDEGQKTRARLDALRLATNDAEDALLKYVNTHRDEITAHQDNIVRETYEQWEAIHQSIEEAHQANTDALNARDWTRQTENRHRKVKLVRIQREPSPEYEKTISEPLIDEAEAAVQAAYASARTLGVL